MSAPMSEQEINEAVARKLGWTLCEEDPSPDFKEWHSPRQGIGICTNKLPDYCRSIEAAWEIVDAGHIDWICRLDTQKWEASKAGLKDGCISDTAPMSICLAFLKLP